MTNSIPFNKWQDFYFKLENNLLLEQHILFALNALFKTLINFPLDYRIVIQFKIKFYNFHFRSISYIQIVKLTEFNDLSELFTEFWNLRDEEYLTLNPSHIVFTYKILKGDNQFIKASKLNRSRFLKENTEIFKGFNLPSTKDISK